jgi:ABC-2 type transport system ATP-binding protein
MAKILEVKNLVKNFGDFAAVDGISFSVDEGQIVGLLGPNGAGMLSVVKNDAGTVKIFGKDLVKSRSEIMENVNYWSAEYNLPWHLTVYESLLVFAKLYNVPKPKERIEELLKLFDSEDLRKKTISDLSFGQKARAGLCKALINKPKLLLLDEPMASMDPDIVDRGIRLLKKIQKEDKIGVLYTSHNMWEIEQIANHVIFINHGKIIASGTPLELTRQELQIKAKEPNLRDVFIHLSRRRQKEISAS